MQFLPSGKKRSGAGKVVVQEIKPTRRPPPQEQRAAPISAYSFWYPDNVANNVSLVDEGHDPVKALEYKDRLQFRQRKKTYFEDQAATFEHFKNGNLAAVHKAFMQLTADDGTLARMAYVHALHSLGVTDTSLIERTFDLFDVRKEGIVDYKEVISALDVILNGTNKQITTRDCFALLDPTGCGYIIKNCLQDLKSEQAEDGDINHLMVKTLIEIIDNLQGVDALQFSESRFRKRRGRKAADPRSKYLTSSSSPTRGGTFNLLNRRKKAALVEQYAKKIHLSYEEFCECLLTNPILVQAFLSRVLVTMENVYMRNKRATAAGFSTQRA
eukprot:NODE_841_length_1294_cov_318.073092_g640_i0.p1 GENE.NODE_841_length_1294_cov_318.073092_g640_i0~~NODE_841_length_1294_cov_318.073092_g640_i0.p1  ORF type:complete len:328 (-),score=55.84 NODE_841_length_1294_cov_318.073092_g640_i0:175-1158(-)